MTTTNQEFRKREHEHISYFNISPVRCHIWYYMVHIKWATGHGQSGRSNRKYMKVDGPHLRLRNSGPSTFLNLQIIGFQRSNTLSSMCSRKRNLILHFTNSYKWISRSSKFKSDKTSKLGWRSIFIQIIL